MDIVKNKLRNKIENEYIFDCLLTQLDRRIVEKSNINSVVDRFYDFNKNVVLDFDEGVITFI